MHTVTQHLRESEPCAVASSGRNRKAARSDDHRPRGDRRSVVQFDDPVVVFTLEVSHPGAEPDPSARFLDASDETVADVTCLVGRRKEFAGLLLKLQRHAEFTLKERSLLRLWPGLQDFPERVRRGIGDVTFRLRHRREDVAPSSPTDQDLSTPILRAFNEDDLSPSARRDQGSHEAGCAGPDDDHRALWRR